MIPECKVIANILGKTKVCGRLLKGSKYKGDTYWFSNKFHPLGPYLDQGFPFGPAIVVGRQGAEAATVAGWPKGHLEYL